MKLDKVDAPLICVVDLIDLLTAIMLFMLSGFK